MTGATLTVGLVALIAVQVVTLGAAGWALVDAVKDWRAILCGGITNGRRIWARSSVRRESIRLVTVAVFTTCTWMLLARSAGVRDGTPSTWAVGVLALFAAGQLLLGVNTLLDWRVREKLNRHVAAAD